MKITASKLLILLLTLAVGFSSCRTNQDTIRLELNLQPGAKYKYTTEMEQDINSMGMVNINLRFTIDLIYEMMPGENEGRKVAITYDHLEMEGTNPMGTMHYDSDAPGKDPAAGELNKLVGKTYYVLLNKDGTVSGVEGMNRIMDSTASASGGSLSDSSFSEIVQNAFDVYPGKPVAVGDSWTRSSKMGISTYQFDVDNTYTLESIADGVAHISLQSKLTLPETGLNDHQKMKMEMSGRQKGTIDIDIATGRIISGTTTQHIEGEMRMADQRIPMTIESTIRTKSEKL